MHGASKLAAQESALGLNFIDVGVRKAPVRNAATPRMLHTSGKMPCAKGNRERNERSSLMAENDSIDSRNGEGAAGAQAAERGSGSGVCRDER